MIAEELHALLQAASISPPHVIVGHSMGGYDVRVYTSLYRNEIVGMVLVDASHPEQENRFPPELKNMEGSWHREVQFIASTMPFGMPRILGLCGNNAATRAAECNWHSSREKLAEIKAFPESAVQAAASGSFGDLPLAVLSHDPDNPGNDLPLDLSKSINEQMQKMQEELAHLSTRGTQTIARNSSHYVQVDRPDIVIEAVRKVVEQARQPRPQSSIESH